MNDAWKLFFNFRSCRSANPSVQQIDAGLNTGLHSFSGASLHTLVPVVQPLCNLKRAIYQYARSRALGTRKESRVVTLTDSFPLQHMEDQPDNPFAGLSPLHQLDEDSGFLSLFPDQPEQDMLEPKPSSAPGALESPLSRGLLLQHAASAAALTGMGPGLAGSSSSPQSSELAESPTAAGARIEVTSGSPPSQAGMVRGRRGKQRGARARPASAKGRVLRRK